MDMWSSGRGRWRKPTKPSGREANRRQQQSRLDKEMHAAALRALATPKPKPKPKPKPGGAQQRNPGQTQLARQWRPFALIRAPKANMHTRLDSVVSHQFFTVDATTLTNFSVVYAPSNIVQTLFVEPGGPGAFIAGNASYSTTWVIGNTAGYVRPSPDLLYGQESRCRGTAFRVRLNFGNNLVLLHPCPLPWSFCFECLAAPRIRYLTAFLSGLWGGFRFPVRPSCASSSGYLARFTKTRVCLSCFCSTNSGHAAFHQDPDLFKLLRLYKSWAPCKCFNFRTAFHVMCLFCFPLILSFHWSCASRRPCRLTLAHFFGHPTYDAPRQ